MVCRLCLNESFNLIEIFGEQGTKMEIPSILSTHFWFELKIDDPVSTSICSRCWHNTENFHVFYLNVKEAQNMLERSSAIGLSPDEVIIKTECTEDDTPNVSLPGSSFFDQNNTRVNATTKSGFVQETVTGYTDKYMKNIPATSTSNFDSTLTEELILKSEHEEYDERGDSFDVDNRYDYLSQSEDDKMTVDPMLNDSKNAKRPQKKPNTNSSLNMPRNYIRKTDRQSWSQESMQKAMEAVNGHKMGWQKASKTFGVPQATLRRHVLSANKSLAPNTKGLGRFKNTFSSNIERQLVDHIKLLETRFFDLTYKEVKELAFQLAELNGISHYFNIEKKRAGQGWMRNFLQRNKDISLRKLEPTSAARAQGFNKAKVQNFFKIYQDLLNIENFGPHRIYNVGESALSTVQKPQQILATTGRKQVGFLTSAERGSNVTVVCCMNATGSYIPPCMIFPRKNMKNEFIDEAPTGTLGIAQPSGWMTSEVFLKWLHHFKNFVKPSIEDKVLLIVDGHSSHKGFEALNFAKQNGIYILCLPAHCTHRLQPVDVCFYGPLKIYFNEEISKWLKSHPGRVVTHLQIGYLLNQAYGKATTVQNACQGFKSTGLWPVNADIFPECMFQPAETTNIVLTNENTSQVHLTTKLLTQQPSSSGLLVSDNQAKITLQSSKIIHNDKNPDSSKDTLIF